MSVARDERDASLVRTGHAWSLIVAGRSYEVSFAETSNAPEALRQAGRGELTVYVNGVAVPVALPGRGARLKPDAPSVGASGASGFRGPGAAQIVAPMPGRIVKVLVKQGDRVAARQGLVVVEAMKMENELRSPKDGVVTDVRAVEGATIDARSVLMTVE